MSNLFKMADRFTEPVAVGENRYCYVAQFLNITTSDKVYTDAGLDFSKYEFVTFNMRGVSTPSYLLASLTIPVGQLVHEQVMMLKYGTTSSSAAANILRFYTHEDNTVTIRYIGGNRCLEIVGWYKPEYVSEAKSNREFLFHLGDTCDNITGGWSSDEYSFYDGSGNARTVTSAKNTAGYLRAVSTSSSVVNLLGTNNLIDLTNYKTLKVRLRGITLYGSAYGHITILDSKTYSNDSIISQNPIPAAGAQTMSIDISNITGEYYITFWACVRESYMFDMWLE